MIELKQQPPSEASLWERYKDYGDYSARDQLILRYTGLVKYTAGRVAIGMPNSVDMEDLISYGIFGLLDAVEKFDPNRGIKFESYATVRIRGAIIDGLRAADWVPRSVRAKARRLERTVAELEFRLGRSASEDEIAKALNLSKEEYYEMLDEVKSTTITSLDELWGEGGEDDFLRLGDMVEDTKLPEPGHELEVEAVKATLAQAIEALSERERQVITLYYYEKLTLRKLVRCYPSLNPSVSNPYPSGGQLRSRLEQIRHAVV